MIDRWKHSKMINGTGMPMTNRHDIFSVFPRNRFSFGDVLKHDLLPAVLLRWQYVKGCQIWFLCKSVNISCCFMSGNDHELTCFGDTHAPKQAIQHWSLLDSSSFSLKKFKSHYCPKISDRWQNANRRCFWRVLLTIYTFSSTRTVIFDEWKEVIYEHAVDWFWRFACDTTWIRCHPGEGGAAGCQKSEVAMCGTFRTMVLTTFEVPNYRIMQFQQLYFTSDEAQQSNTYTMINLELFRTPLRSFCNNARHTISTQQREGGHE